MHVDSLRSCFSLSLAAFEMLFSPPSHHHGIMVIMLRSDKGGSSQLPCIPPHSLFLFCRGHFVTNVVLFCIK